MTRDLAYEIFCLLQDIDNILELCSEIEHDELKLYLSKLKEILKNCD